MEKVSFGPIWDDIQKIRNSKWLDEAIKLANDYLISNPNNHEALLQLVDIYYVKWELEKAEKPVDFLLQTDNLNIDKTILYYIKAVICLDKTLWNEAKYYIKKSLKKDPNNPEFLRVYWLAEFWSWNKNKWFDILQNALELGFFDAEIFLELVSMALKMQDFESALKYVKMYFKNKDKITYFSNSSEYYDSRMKMYLEFLKNNTK